MASGLGLRLPLLLFRGRRGGGGRSFGLGFRVSFRRPAKGLGFMAGLRGLVCLGLWGGVFCLRGIKDSLPGFVYGFVKGLLQEVR